jgi:hypothetical protein
MKPTKHIVVLKEHRVRLQHFWFGPKSLDFTSQAESVVKMNCLYAIYTAQFKHSRSIKSQVLLLITDVLLSREADKKKYHLAITIDSNIITKVLAFRFGLKDIMNHLFRRINMSTIYQCGNLSSKLSAHELRDNLCDAIEYVISIYEAAGLEGVVEYFEQLTLLITSLLRKYGHHNPSRIRTLIRIIAEQVELSINGICRFLRNPTKDLQTKYSLLDGPMHHQMIEKVIEFSSCEDSKTWLSEEKMDGVVLSYSAGIARLAQLWTTRQESSESCSSWYM